MTIKMSLVFLSVVLVAGCYVVDSCCAVGGNVSNYFVKPTPGYDCKQMEPCLMLSDYLQHPNVFFQSNTTIWFCPGRHVINQTNVTTVFISNIRDLTLVGGYNSVITTSSLATLQCTERMNLVFMNVNNLTISSLRFLNCGSQLPDKVLNSAGNLVKLQMETQAALVFVQVSSFVLDKVQVEGSYGYGLLVVDTTGNSSINACKFSYNSWKPTYIWAENDSTSSLGTSKPGGNVLIVFPNDPHITGSALKLSDISLHITCSEFAHGSDNSTWFEYGGSKPLFLGGGSGVGIFLFGSTYISRFVKIYISECNFYNNTAPVGANSLLFFRIAGLSYLSGVPLQAYSIHFSKCNFQNGAADRRGGGLSIDASHHETYGSKGLFTVDISNSTFTRNVGYGGGGLAVLYTMATDVGIHPLQTGLLVLRVYDCVFHENEAYLGGGVNLAIRVRYDVVLNTFHRLIYLLNITVLESTFLLNTAVEGGGVYLSTYDVINYKEIIGELSSIVAFNNCHFSENKARKGYALRIDSCAKETITQSGIVLKIHSPHCIQADTTSIILAESVFKRNTAIEAHLVYLMESAVYMFRTSTTLSNTILQENKGSAIYAVQSKIILKGVVNITGNTGYSGGAFYLDCTTLKLTSEPQPVSLYLTNNTALQFGGGIAAKTCPDSDECFFQFDEWDTSPGNYCFVYDNKAVVAGDSIYDHYGSLETCNLIQATNTPEKLTQNTFFSIFHIPEPHSSSEIVSPAYKVCFCNDNHFAVDFCQTEKHIELYPGQSFYIPAVGVGEYGNAIPSVIHTEIAKGFAGELGDMQNTQEIGRECGNLTYTLITSKAQIIDFYISIKGTMYPQVSPSILQVIVQPCPFGFELSSSSCDCAKHLQISGIECDISTLRLHLPPSVWIGNYSGDVVIHSNCPFDYCVPQAVEISLYDQDKQCAFNHSGILCGGCQRGHSLALGSSQCLQCSNVYLLLVIPFLLAGVALVFLLLKCNLNVSVGTINGLIFYANIIRVNYAVFFPHGDTSNFVNFLSVFIAWLNLDVGIETCFFDGMSAYSKTWLQFLFPFYIWILTGSMIFISRYSVTVSRITGSNAVPVLATLYLLSYAKLLRTVIAAVSPAVFKSRSGAPITVWLLDGNVAFLRWPHAALFVMALIVTFAYIIPFTLLVLLAPFLQANSGHHLLRWVNKMKPLLDAYQGPYKDKFRFWSGITLIFCTALFVVFASNAFGDPSVNLLAIVAAILVLLVVLWSTGRVHKNYLVHTIECFFLLNLGIFAMATLSLKSSEANLHKQELLSGIMVGSTFVVFCLIIVYHCYLQFRTIRRTRDFLAYCQRKLSRHPEAGADLAEEPCQNIVAHSQPTVTIIDLSQLREPLLTDN